MKKTLLLISFLLVAASAHAQTANATAIWTQTEAPALAQTFTETLQVDTTAPVAITATCVAAVTPATGSVCSAPFTVAAPTNSHSYVLVVCDQVGCSSMSIGGAVPGTGGFKVKVTVIVGGS